jgi:hypothetical protein
MTVRIMRQAPDLTANSPSKSVIIAQVRWGSAMKRADCFAARSWPQISVISEA